MFPPDNHFLVHALLLVAPTTYKLRFRPANVRNWPIIVSTDSQQCVKCLAEVFYRTVKTIPTAVDTHLWPEINDQITADLRDELMHFAETVQTYAPFVQDYREALAAIRVLDALFASLKQDCPVAVATE